MGIWEPRRSMPMRRMAMGSSTWPAMSGNGARTTSRPAIIWKHPTPTRSIGARATTGRCGAAPSSATNPTATGIASLHAAPMRPTALRAISAFASSKLHEDLNRPLTYYLPIAEMPVSVLLILGMGAAVGFISGLFGIGGGFLMTPLLIFLGIPPAVAVATQSAQIVASSTTSVLGALRRNALDHKLGAILVAGGFVGSALGVWFFAAARRAGQLDLVIVVSYVSLFTIVGSLMLKESLREFWSSRRGGPMRPR